MRPLLTRQQKRLIVYTELFGCCLMGVVWVAGIAFLRWLIGVNLATIAGGVALFFPTMWCAERFVIPFLERKLARFYPR